MASTYERVDQGLRAAQTVIGWKATLIKVIIFGVLAAMLGFVLVIAALIGAPAQSSTTVWPVPVTTDAKGQYVAAGWSVSSKYGWRTSPSTGKPEFHDGLDLVAAPDTACPFGLYCPVPSMFDGTVVYVGWDQPMARNPDKTGGGEIVVIANGDEQFHTVMAHLQPYRLHIQLQGRVVDEHGRYGAYRNYQPIGADPLTPADDASQSITMNCNDDAHFVATAHGLSGVSFVYDKPADCTTSVTWGTKGGGWDGWTPDGAVATTWTTPFSKDSVLAFFEGEARHRAGDVALRFRAHLRPPPPPPEPDDNGPVTPGAPGDDPAPPPMGAVSGGQGSVAPDGMGVQAIRGTLPAALPVTTHTPGDGQPNTCVPGAPGRMSCTWVVRDIPQDDAAAPAPLIAAQGSMAHGGRAAAPAAPQPTPGPDILPTPKPIHNPVVTPEPGTGVTGPSVPKSAPCMVAVAYALAHQGAIYSQQGVMDGDPIDPATGRYYSRTGPNSFDCSGLVWRAYMEAGVTVGTTTFSQQSSGVPIPCTLAQLDGPNTTCWAPGDIALFFDGGSPFHVVMYVGNGTFFGCENHKLGCMLLTHMKTSTYYHSYPMMARRITGECIGLALDPGVPLTDPLVPPVRDDPTMCIAGSPTFGSSYEELPGCGPPVHKKHKVYQLDSTVGFIGLTGATTGPHLHVGMQMRRYDDVWSYTNVCTTDMLQGRTPPRNPSDCWTDMVDPMEFLPRATGGTNVGAGAALLADGAPYQLPPPDYPHSLVYDEPGAKKMGQYWSPYADGGQYGGGGLWDWILSWFR